MAELIDSDEFPKKHPKYPWDMWLAVGSTWKAIKGEDFTCDPENFIAAVYAAAKKRKIKVEVSKREDIVFWRVASG